MTRPVRVTFHPVFALMSAGLVLLTVTGASWLEVGTGIVTLTLVLVLWRLYGRRRGD